MIALPTILLRAVPIAALVGLAGFAIWFRHHQARGRLGGAISRAKSFWLSLAIFFWFALCPIVALDARVAEPLRVVLAVFAVAMWLRGAAEMFLLYVVKRWQPPMGIAHDALCVAWLVAGLAMTTTTSLIAEPINAWTMVLICVLIGSLVVEMMHAVRFHVVVHGHTTGADGVWFASEYEERFRKINESTRFWNVCIASALTLFLVRYLGLWAF